MTWPVALFGLALLGLVIGSFLNVVIYRVPRGESLWRPASHCPRCKAPIRPWHNVPVLSWVLLRGRCAACADPIDARYPLVELVTAALFVAVPVRLYQLHWLSAVPAYLYFAATGVSLAFIDIDVRRLPNAIVGPAYPVLAVLLAASAASQHDWSALVRAALGGAALFGVYLLIAFGYPAAMGMGDVKLAGLIGGLLAYLSWSTLVLGSFAGFLLGALFGVALMAMGRGGRTTAVSFGPFMVAGALLGVFVATPVAAAYQRLMTGA